MNERYHADFLIQFRTITYNPDDGYPYEEYRAHFKDTDTVKDGNYWMISSTMPPEVKLAYVASLIYPEIYGADYGIQTHQEYIDKFVVNLSLIEYKVTERKFILSDDDFPHVTA